MSASGRALNATLKRDLAHDVRLESRILSAQREFQSQRLHEQRRNHAQRLQAKRLARRMTTGIGGGAHDPPRTKHELDEIQRVKSMPK